MPCGRCSAGVHAYVGPSSGRQLLDRRKVPTYSRYSVIIGLALLTVTINSILKCRAAYTTKRVRILGYLLIEGILYVSLHIVEPKTIPFLLILCCPSLLRNQTHRPATVYLHLDDLQPGFHVGSQDRHVKSQPTFSEEHSFSYFVAFPTSPNTLTGPMLYFALHPQRITYATGHCHPG